jgi:predicted HAD superfamily Cof-like phosphohydrolase
MISENNDIITQTQKWFEVAVPNPTSKNISTQIGCHLEEVVEMLDVLQTKYPGYKNKLDDARKHLRFISNLLKQEEDSFFIKEEDRKELLDSLADQIVTATGVGTFLGMNVPGALAEVNRSNYSKFEDGEPVFNENKKVMKGKDYTPPDLTPYI